MGTSKIILISGVYMILGLYTFGLNSADENQCKQALSVAQSVQTEQIAESGISLALVYMGNNSAILSFSPITKSTMGGTVAYSASHPASLSLTEREIVSTATMVCGTATVCVKKTAIVHFDKGLWRIIRTYSQNI